MPLRSLGTLFVALPFMILSTDNYQRIYDQLRNEREAVRYHLRKNEKYMEKRMRSARSVPVWCCDTITMPKTGNTYLLYYYALTWNEIRGGTCWNGAPLLVNDENGHRVAIMLRHMMERDTETKEEMSYDTLQVYSGHFFSRYRERMGLPDRLSTNDVIATFFGRNEGYFAELDYDEFILEKNRHKGNRVYGVDDGVTLAEVTVLDSGVRVFKHNTFLSRNELKGQQVCATPSQDRLRAASLAWELQRKKKK